MLFNNGAFRAWKHIWEDGVSLHDSPDGASAYARDQEGQRPKDNMPRTVVIEDEDLLKRIQNEKNIKMSSSEFDKLLDTVKEL